MTTTNPVVFIHGLWIHSAAWAAWIELFESRGYSASAPGWPADGPIVAATGENPDAPNDMGIPQMLDHYAQLIGTPEVKPVVVGHSFGGLIAQELLANGVVAAAVAIDPAAIKGEPRQGACNDRLIVGSQRARHPPQRRLVAK